MDGRFGTDEPAVGEHRVGIGNDEYDPRCFGTADESSGYAGLGRHGSGGLAGDGDPDVPLDPVHPCAGDAGLRCFEDDGDDEPLGRHDRRLVQGWSSDILSTAFGEYDDLDLFDVP